MKKEAVEDLNFMFKASGFTGAGKLWGGDYISIDLFKKPALALPLKLLVFTIPIITILHILLDVLRGFKKINLRVVVENYFLPLSNLLMILIFYLLGYRLEGAIIAFIASNVVSLTILIFLNRKRIKMTGPAPFLGVVCGRAGRYGRRYL
ncbi:MAG: hypothetical protein GTO45_32495 [Candidatus Aminicenantes bacterium]|nr:hypothetical protein [Candidatus Aminicenantes bacterium]NIM83470.1 hypothetical protein [Candidatus Aminicenantes bacterium]NIN22862.1 hypothetical protein [Candidatus Aminicenantes bacterium]NIN46598.1 hypothetical protein [Candidatus Aminicenantes bacterium]NIN89501.1 hypothetical protein [Candidatus Aminicenantes bacterium]